MELTEKHVEKHTVSVREAVLSDAPQIREINKEAFLKYAHDANLSHVDALEETLQDIENDIDNKLVLVAEYHGAITGSLRIEMKQDATAYITRFGVCGSHRSKGIGKCLMEVVDALMKGSGIRELQLHTATNARDNVIFYYKCGFYIKSMSNSRGYPRGLFVKEYVESGER